MFFLKKNQITCNENVSNLMNQENFSGMLITMEDCFIQKESIEEK